MLDGHLDSQQFEMLSQSIDEAYQRNNRTAPAGSETISFITNVERNVLKRSAEFNKVSLYRREIGSLSFGKGIDGCIERQSPEEVVRANEWTSKSQLSKLFQLLHSRDKRGRCLKCQFTNDSPILRGFELSKFACI
uniref:Uncharacterized protein n=1 Tax=Vespula pensylvanica TaxID=30213 RepID=A0A834PFA8_VESPE|nr:hypothetical protein H0235_001000 [Vespula pensylvanica]